MADVTIANLPTAGGIDGSADYLAIETASPHATNKINRNSFLGITSQPLGLTDTQSPTNKTFNNTTVLTIKDTNFTLQDDGDTTKQARFQLSGITTATTRTYTLPNASSTLVDLSSSQTMTNKTLTSPVINGGTMDNTTVTVDSIAGHSSSTVVTVANLQISNGVLNSANAVTSTSIAAGAVQPQALQSGTGTGWAMSSYTPTLVNITIGTGGSVANTARYIQIGKTVYARGTIILGSSGASVGTGTTFTLPVTASSAITIIGVEPIGQVIMADSGTAQYTGVVYMNSSTVASFQPMNASATNTTTTAGVTATSPFAWGAGDFFTWSIIYEAA